MALRRHMKNFVKHYSEAEIKVREATSNDPWGPSSSLMLEISDLTYNAASLSEIMGMIWHRMNDHGKNWRHVYKSLTLVDYLLKNGSKKVIQHCQEGYYNIQMLKDFQHLDEAGKDQGFHVREKSKQVIALLTDEQLLHNEREIARRTRRRTSHAMLFQKAFSKPYVPVMPGPDMPPFPPSENVQHFPPKASPAAEHIQPTPISDQIEMVPMTTARNKGAKKSTEDLIVFSEDEPSSSMQPKFPTRFPREELAADTTESANNPWNASSASSSSEINVAPSPKWDSSWKLKSSVIPRALLKTPPRKLSSGTAHRVAATLLNAWSISPEELSVPNQEVSKADFARCGSSASVETIYLSPAFQAFDPLGKGAANTIKSAPSPSRPTPPNIQTLNFTIPPNTTRTDQLSSNPSPRPDSISSIRTTSSFSTFSMLSSPESIVPSNTPQPHCVPSQGTSYFTSPHGLPSIFFKDLKKRIAHSFSPFPASDLDENENVSVLELLPDNSKCSVQNTDGFRSRTCRASGESWDCIAPSSPNLSLPPGSSFPSTDLLCGSVEEKGMVILEEFKNAACGLRQDFGKMTEELRSVTKELTNVATSIQHVSKFLAAAQPVKDTSDSA